MNDAYRLKPQHDGILKYWGEFLNSKSWHPWQAMPPDPAAIEKAAVLGKEAPKWAKVPINPKDGKRGDPSNPDTRDTFQAAWDYYARNSLEMAGVGTNLKDSGINAIDLDHIFNKDGKIKKIVLDIINKIKSYTELTPSGDGCRIYVRDAGLKGRKPKKGWSNGGEETQDIEFFGNGNLYVTVTGKPLSLALNPTTTIEDRSKEIKELYNQVFPGGKEEKREYEEVNRLSLAEEFDAIGIEYKFKDSEHEGKKGIKFLIRCPWGENHSDRNNVGDAFIFIPDEDENPWFFCSHTGCSGNKKKSFREYYKKVFGYSYNNRNLSKEIDEFILPQEGTEFNYDWLERRLGIFGKERENEYVHMGRLIGKDLIEKHPTKAGWFRVRVKPKKGSLIGAPAPEPILILLPLDLNLIIQVCREDIILVGGLTAAGKTTFNFHAGYLNYGRIPIVYIANVEISQREKNARSEYFIAEQHPLSYWQDRSKWDWEEITPPAKFHDSISQYHNTLIICDYFMDEDCSQSGNNMNEIQRRLKGTGSVAIVSIQLHKVKNSSLNAFDLKAYGGDPVTFPVATFIKLVQHERFDNENVLAIDKVRTPQPGKETRGWSRNFKITKNGGWMEPTSEWKVGGIVPNGMKEVYKDGEMVRYAYKKGNEK